MAGIGSRVKQIPSYRIGKTCYHLRLANRRCIRTVLTFLGPPTRCQACFYLCRCYCSWMGLFGRAIVVLLIVRFYHQRPSNCVFTRQTLMRESHCLDLVSNVVLYRGPTLCRINLFHSLQCPAALCIVLVILGGPAA